MNSDELLLQLCNEVKKIQTDLRRLRRDLRRPEEKRYRYKDLVDRLQMSKDSVYRLWSSGELASQKMTLPGGRAVRYSTEAQVREYERSQ